MVRVVGLAHKPAVGVKVYVVVAVLFIAGLHVPVIPFVDVVGKVEIIAPEQYGPTALKVGVIFELTVTLSVVEIAHCPAVGVKVYVVVPEELVLIIAGFHVPVIPLFEVVGNVPGDAPTQ